MAGETSDRWQVEAGGSPAGDVRIVRDRARPPHAGRQALIRTHLHERLLAAARQPLLALVAGAGYGKTSLLIQLRKELLATGAAVSWLSALAGETAVVFVPALVESLRAALGERIVMPSLDRVSGTGTDLWLASELLAQIEEQAMPVWMLIDDLHNLVDGHAVEFIHYLVCNAPANFHVIVGSRAELPFPVLDLQAQGRLALFGTDELRFDLADTVSFLRARFGDDLEIDACARLHERTGGWPMALQLVVAAMGRRGTLPGEVSELSGSVGDIARYFERLMATKMTPEVATMLVRSSILKALHPQLCALLGELPHCDDALLKLEQRTGIVSSTEGDGDVYHAHPLFREYLASLARELPEAERTGLHRISAEWYAQRGRYEEAAGHAFHAGMRREAMDWIERCLRQLGSQGRIMEVLAWLDRLPAEELERREGVQLTAAWACALCHRPEDAERLAQIILQRSGVAPETVLQANIVRSAAAIHGDDLERARNCIEGHGQPLGSLHCNSLSFLAIHSGEPEKARYYQRLAGRSDSPRNHADAMYGAFAVGLSYLVEGQAGAARRVFGEAIGLAEICTGRRTPAAALQAAGLAAACWELGEEQQARSLLAGRLDLIEHSALPDGVLFAHVVLARHDFRSGREDRALDVLNNLAAIGRARSQPRLIATSLAEQLRQHALRNRLEACRALLDRIDELLAGPEMPARGFAPQLQLVREIAAARTALLDYDGARAREALDRAARVAHELMRGRDVITIGLLRSACPQETKDDGLRHLAEALSLAESLGLVRAVADDWPMVADCLPLLAESGHWLTRYGLSQEFVERTAACCRAGASPEPDAPAVPDRRSHAQTTSRELEILQALALGHSNKEVARILDIEPTTVKWHLKNLFAKLGALNRRHLVDRARLMGILG